ncbi:ABC transporter substrate-binding protein [Enterobacter hormaechei]|uniref:ABC transporter substrate-binding protein n=1 Tax=Enterobacter hormaechei TaxID=158836 RepID=A0A4Y5ZWG5_9ENTR|nr:ABC transporter substrate-binding protein [Enterobacter hormaechei]
MIPHAYIQNGDCRPDLRHPQRGRAAQDVTVMISGGFKAALEKLTPQYEAQSGDRLIVISGPSMGKTPQAIPAQLARGEKRTW